MENKFLLRGREYLGVKGKHLDYIEKCGRYLYLIDSAKSDDIRNKYIKTLEGVSFWATYEGDISGLSRADKLKLRMSVDTSLQDRIKTNWKLSMTDEVLLKQKVNQKAYFESLTDEERVDFASRMIVGRKTWLEGLSEECRKDLSRKCSKGIYESTTKEDRVLRGKMGGLGNKLRSPYDKELTRRKHLRENLSSETIRKMELSQRKRFEKWSDDDKDLHAVKSRSGWEGKKVSTNHISKSENEIKKFIEDSGFSVVQSYWGLLGSKEIDLFIPEVNLAIEFNGSYWHSVQSLMKKARLNRTAAFNYHQRKTLDCLDKGVHLIHIWDYEWNDPRIRERLKSQILGCLGKSNRVYARNCSIEELDKGVATKFFNDNSEFRSKPFLKAFGLFNNGNLVMAYGVCHLQTGRGYDKNNIEIGRSATILNTVVVGGSSKLMKRVRDEFPDKPIHYFVDLDKHTGSSLKAMGAKLLHVGSPTTRIMFKKSCILSNDRGESVRVRTGKVYSRMPKFHYAIKEQDALGNILTLANAGTLHYVLNL